MKKISIITVTYNSIKTLELTLKSIQSEKNEFVEYIVIDGASNDGTVDLLRKYSSMIDHLVSEKDLGIYNAMNKGIQKAKGEFLFFINSDDQLVRGAVSRILESLEEIPTTQVLCAPVVVLNREGREKGLFSPVSYKKNKKYYAIPCCHQGMILERELVEAFKGFDESFKVIADFDLLLKCFAATSNVRTLDFPVAKFRVGGVSVNPLKYRNELIRLYKKNNYNPILYSLFLFKSEVSIRLQMFLPKGITRLVKKIKKSQFENCEL